MFAYLATKKMKMVPKGVQNFAEMVVEVVYGLVVSVAGEKRAPSFFPWVATIFIFVLISNYLGLLPGLAAVGVKVAHEGKEGIIPFLRSPSTDLNMTVGLALISVFTTQYYGIRALGASKYMGKFINVKGLFSLPAILAGEEKEAEGIDLIMDIFRRAIIDPFVGLLELVSEFAKIISFSFRLFGNIFAGEVMLLVIGFLLPYLGTPAFLGLELFVGLIQAFIFAVLTLAFMTMATLTFE
jgi:F-type H+-transporting ATPase subunit a